MLDAFDPAMLSQLLKAFGSAAQGVNVARNPTPIGTTNFALRAAPQLAKFGSQALDATGATQGLAESVGGYAASAAPYISAAVKASSLIPTLMNDRVSDAGKAAASLKAVNNVVANVFAPGVGGFLSDTFAGPFVDEIFLGADREKKRKAQSKAQVARKSFLDEGAFNALPRESTSQQDMLRYLLNTQQIPQETMDSLYATGKAPFGSPWSWDKINTMTNRMVQNLPGTEARAAGVITPAQEFASNPQGLTPEEIIWGMSGGDDPIARAQMQNEMAFGPNAGGGSFKYGGRVPQTGRSLVHRNEHVMNQPAAARFRPILEAMNAMMRPQVGRRG